MCKCIHNCALLKMAVLCSIWMEICAICQAKMCKMEKMPHSILFQAFLVLWKCEFSNFYTTSYIAKRLRESWKDFQLIWVTLTSAEVLRLGPPHRLGYWDPWLWSDTRGRSVEAARGWGRGRCSGHRRPCPLGINECLLVDIRRNIKSMLIYKASVIRPMSINRRLFYFDQKIKVDQDSSYDSGFRQTWQ